MMKRSSIAVGRQFGRVLVLASLVGFGFSWAAIADDDMPAAGSAKARLAELRKQRGAQEKSAAKAKPPAKAASGDEYPWATPDDVTYINPMLEDEWKALGFPVAAECTDGEFVRRASLDIIGRIPTLAETEAFLKDRTVNSRTRLVNRLLATEEYGRNFATVWTNLLITDGRATGNNQDTNPDALRAWLEKEFNRNTGWNKIVFEMIAANGPWDENPAVNFIVANEMNNGNAIKVTSYLSRLFLGVQTQCTECHDHPWNDWKQEQFHGINAFFSTTRRRRVTRTTPNGQVATERYDLEEMPIRPNEINDKGAFFERRNGLQVFTLPAYLDGRDVNALRRGDKARVRGAKPKLANANQVAESVDQFFANQNKTGGDEPFYLRTELAKVVTAPDNPYFGRAIVNRLWYHCMGHSFIKNVDDFDNGQDEPSMPELLNKLAEDFKNHNYDLKRLTRWICTSKAYSQSTKHKGKENKEATGFFTTMLVKPMSPEQLYDSVMTLTEVHKTTKSTNTAEVRQRFLQEFLRTFGADEQQTTAPKYNGTITQSLMMMNSGVLTEATSCKQGTFVHRLASDARHGPIEKVDAIYLAALSRRPTAGERQYLNQLMQRSKSQAEFLEDALWVILNSAEFALNY